MASKGNKRGPKDGPTRTRIAGVGFDSSSNSAHDTNAAAATHVSGSQAVAHANTASASGSTQPAAAAAVQVHAPAAAAAAAPSSSESARPPKRSRFADAPPAQPAAAPQQLPPNDAQPGAQSATQQQPRQNDAALPTCPPAHRQVKANEFSSAPPLAAPNSTAAQQASQPVVPKGFVPSADTVGGVEAAPSIVAPMRNQQVDNAPAPGCRSGCRCLRLQCTYMCSGRCLVFSVMLVRNDAPKNCAWCECCVDLTHA